MSIQQIIQGYQQRVNQKLHSHLNHSSLEPDLQNAMRYALFNGGKRVRPMLVYLVNQLLGGHLDSADDAACAIECIHSYSLVHDDLPAMDNDDLRRGKPTCHIAFNEATAILAGDGLQCYAFELLSHSNLAPQIKINLIQELARAAGDRGMVAGQAFDLSHVNQPLTLQQLEKMHHCKTGALINAAIVMGYHTADVQDTDVLNTLRRFGDAIGLAFQVKDDILDIEGDTATLGKPQGSDLEQNKPTYPALLGLDGAKNKLSELHQTAHNAAQQLGKQGANLALLADYIVNRDH